MKPRPRKQREVNPEVAVTYEEAAIVKAAAVADQAAKHLALTGPLSMAEASKGRVGLSAFRIEDPRRAILLMEILNPPVALREAGARDL